MPDDFTRTYDEIGKLLALGLTVDEEKDSVPRMAINELRLRKNDDGTFTISGPEGFNDIIYVAASKTIHEVHRRMNYLKTSKDAVSPAEEEEDRKIIPFVFARPR